MQATTWKSWNWSTMPKQLVHISIGPDDKPLAVHDLWPMFIINLDALISFILSVVFPVLYVFAVVWYLCFFSHQLFVDSHHLVSTLPTFYKYVIGEEAIFELFAVAVLQLNKYFWIFLFFIIIRGQIKLGD